MGKTSTKLAYFGLSAAILACAQPASAEFAFNAVASYPTATAGVYSFTTEKYAPKQIARNVFASGGGIAFNDGYYYGVRYEYVMGLPAIAQQSYDMKTWEVSDNYTGKLTDVATANTYDRDLGLAFGCYYNEDGQSFRFCQVNVAYFSTTTIAELPKPWGACGFNKDGVLYAIDEDGTLHTVNIDNGALTTVGETGLKTEWITGGIVDKESNVMIYAVKNDTEAALYSVDLSTASATKLYDLENEEQLGGFFEAEKEYAATVPAAPYYTPSPSFSGTALAGKLAFYTPTSLYDGTAGLNDVTYHIYDNGKEIASGAADYNGTRKSIDIEVSTGYHCFAVAFSNASGEGPRKYSDVKYYGVDTPKAPASASVTYTDGDVKVSWGGVSSGMHNGTIDRANLTYRVTRYPEGIVVSPADQKTTSFTDHIDTPATRTTYWYTVEAVTGDLVSAAVKTPTFALGPIVPPYEVSYQASSDFIGYTSIPTDGKSWSFNSSAKCIYVSTSAAPANNWVVLPALQLKAGESYDFTMRARSYGSSYTETFEVMCGTAPTVEAMTQTVIEPSMVNGSTDGEFTGTISAETDGTYYVAIHATTPSKGAYLYVSGISIAAGVSDRAPAGVTDLTITPDPSGAHAAELSFNIPATTLGGAPIDEISKVEIYRDGQLIDTLTDNITPGTKTTYTDSKDLSGGVHSYTVICYNRYGAGAESKADTYIGFQAPLAVSKVTMTETTNGHVFASWTPVTADIAGHKLTENDVTYNVYMYLAGDVYPIAENVSGNTYEFDAFDGFDFDGQRFIQTLVEACTEGGKAKIVPSDQTPVGTPYTAPWSESFANCSVNSIFANQVINGSDKWTMVPSDDWGVTPYDNDGGMMYFEGYGRSACALASGKIDLADLVSPAFVFQVFHYSSTSPNENEFEVEVRTSDSEFTTVYSSKIMDMGPAGEWCKVTVPLEDYAGQVIQLRVIARNNSFGFSHMDAWKIVSAAPYNLAFNNISAPSTVDPGTDFSIDATVENLGTERALGYKVSLYMDGEFVETKNGTALENEETVTYSFTQNLSVIAVGDHTYTLEIEYGPDMFSGDNTAELNVTVRSNNLPAVTTLEGKNSDGTVNLTWTAPSALSIPAASTENFDAPAMSWATEIEGWTFLDLDKGTMGGIGSKKLPVAGQQSFFVMDNTLEALQTGNTSSFNAHSGHQYLCSMYALKGGNMVQSDDWAISPELTGDAQLITLWATSFLATPGDTQYLETFQILYSTTGTNPADFTLIEEFANIPAQWRSYSAYLPEGTKYFAIRCVSYDQYMLFVDDVTFMAKNGATKTVEVKGYNVYRNGTLLNEEPLTATSYADNSIDSKSEYTYAVTALYDEGESLKSNEVTIDTNTDAIDSAIAGGIRIFSTSGAAVVTGAEGLAIEVYAADGSTIAATTGEARTTISLAPGFYLVKAGNAVAKVAIR